jgi:prepilin-type N-terminal cleavage/methylation domain-containing protein
MGSLALNIQIRGQFFDCQPPPGKGCIMKIKTMRTPLGFTLVEIMIVVAIIGLLAAIAIPNFIKARATTQQQACISNMQHIDGAITEWALENNKTTGATPPNVTGLTTLGYLHTPGGKPPTCPALGSYNIAPVGTVPSVACSLSSLVNQPHMPQ